MRPDDLPGRRTREACRGRHGDSIQSARHVWPAVGEDLGGVPREGHAAAEGEGDQSFLRIAIVPNGRPGHICEVTANDRRTRDIRASYNQRGRSCHSICHVSFAHEIPMILASEPRGRGMSTAQSSSAGRCSRSAGKSRAPEWPPRCSAPISGSARKRSSGFSIDW